VSAFAQVLDRVIAYAARDEAEVVKAREEWAEGAGRVFADDELYEERTTAFLEWYALERPVAGGNGKVPAERFLAEETTAFLEWYALERPVAGGNGKVPAERFLAEETIDDLQGQWVHALARSHRSLFEVQKVHEGVILLDDLLSGGSFAVTERRRLPGVEEREILEARIVANVVSPPEILFTRGFQFHPQEARVELKRQAERARKAGEPRAETLFRLLRLRLKALRYKHVGPDKIYKEE
jgi:hypothetical protein